MRTINLSLQREKAYPISRQLYGLFLEDINFACDGGLNANMVANYSFDGLYYDRRARKALSDPLRYWSLRGGTMESIAAGQLEENTRFLSFYVAERAVLSNLGYNGHGQYASKPAMSVLEGGSYCFSCSIRGNYEGTVEVRVEDEEGEALTDSFRFTAEKAWRKVETVLGGLADGYGKLVLEFSGKGYIDLDLVSLMNADYWGKDDPKWAEGKLRADLVRDLKDLHPSFLRFPGGCIVEGRGPGNEYNWKDTVGPLAERKANYNLWGRTMKDGGYSQSYQIGFYEYLCLCEDIGASPLPALSAGLYCQKRSLRKIALSDPVFEHEIVANYLDLIEFCKGAAGSSYWADLRIRMGHPAPFDLKMIAVGSENFGPGYRKRFLKIEEAVHRSHPEIRLVFAGGLTPYRLFLAPKWRFAKLHNAGGWLDEHLMHSPAWFIRKTRRYDRYERGTAKVCLGEYAANGLFAGRKYAIEKANPYESALAEAAFLTGIERNADVVEMASYAPLLNMVGGVNYSHSLIEFSPRYTMRTANYKVQELFASGVGENYIPMRVKLPKRVYASCTYDGSAYYLKVVNTGRARYGLCVPAAQMTHRYLQADLSARNLLTFRARPVHSVDFCEGAVNPPRDEFDGVLVKRDETAAVSQLGLIRAHSVNLFVIKES